MSTVPVDQTVDRPIARSLRPIEPKMVVRPAALVAGALGVTGLLFMATPLDGPIGFAVVAYLLFLAGYAAVLHISEEPLARNDRLATVIIGTTALFAIVPLLLILGLVIIKGIGALSGSFFTETMADVGPLDPASAGGAKHAILGTLMQVGIATVMSVPIGVMTAVYLTEFAGRRIANVIRFLVDAMSGIPSIVAGLFVFTLLVLELEQGFSGFAGACALAVLMLPTVTRTAEEVLNLVPGGLREAALALGAPRWKVVSSIVLPTARSGLVTAIVLGIARVAGETAPLLLTSLGSDGVNLNPLEGQQSALPLFVFKQIRNPIESQVARAWTGALVLILIVLILFTAARLIAGHTTKDTH